MVLLEVRQLCTYTITYADLHITYAECNSFLLQTQTRLSDVTDLKIVRADHFFLLL